MISIWRHQAFTVCKYFLDTQNLLIQLSTGLSLVNYWLIKTKSLNNQVLYQHLSSSLLPFMRNDINKMFNKKIIDIEETNILIGRIFSTVLSLVIWRHCAHWKRSVVLDVKDELWWPQHTMTNVRQNIKYFDKAPIHHTLQHICPSENCICIIFSFPA